MRDCILQYAINGDAWALVARFYNTIDNNDRLPVFVYMNSYSIFRTHHVCVQYIE